MDIPFNLVDIPTILKNFYTSSLVLFTIKNTLRKHHLNTQKHTFDCDTAMLVKSSGVGQISKSHRQPSIIEQQIVLKSSNKQNYFVSVYKEEKIKIQRLSSEFFTFKTPIVMFNTDQIKLKLFNQIFNSNKYGLSTTTLPVNIYNNFPLLTTKYFTSVRKRSNHAFAGITSDMIRYNTIKTWFKPLTVSFSNYQPLHRFNQQTNHIILTNRNPQLSGFYTEFILTFLEKYIHSKI